MSEIKPKLNLRPSVVLGEKSPPPTGLLINHGKPNFTICRTKKQQNFIDTVESARQTTQLTLNRSFLLKRTNRSFEAKKPTEENDRNEFLEAHKKISEKIAKENNENILKAELNNNNHVALAKTELTKEVQIIKLNNGQLNTDDGTNIKTNEQNIVALKTNGHFKPSLPEKPAALQNYKPLSPTRLKAVNTKNPTTIIISTNNNNNGVNFEPKTMVSFSKDLSLEPNNYPDTVKLVKSVDNNIMTQNDRDISYELSKLKFEIGLNGEEIVPIKKNP